MENHQLPRNRKRRCPSYWSHHHMRCIPLCVGNWKRQRKSSRKLTAFCICGSVHIPDLHRLLAHFGASSSAYTTRISTFPTDHHGILYDNTISVLDLTISSAIRIYLPLRGFPNHYPFGYHIPSLQDFRLLRSDSNHPSCKRPRSSSVI